MECYRIKTAWDETIVACDLAQAACGIEIIRDDGSRYSTPFQVADGCHDELKIAVLLFEYWGVDYHGFGDIGEEGWHAETGEVTYDGLTEREHILACIESVERLEDDDEDD